MKALLLAGGYGTRLRPLTEIVPKCLVPIKGIPLLELWLQNFTLAGIGPTLVNTHYLPEAVHAYVAQSRFKHSVTLVYESELLGTAGTLLKNADFFEGNDGLMAHADNYCLADFAGFIRAHTDRPKHCLMTMMTFRTTTPSACGIVEIDEHNVVQAFHEKVQNPPSNLANGAIYLLSSDFTKILRSSLNSATDFSTEVIPFFIGKIYSHETSAQLLDIGTPETYALANRRLEHNE